MIELEVDGWIVRLSFLAYGDYDHDGIEDNLVSVTPSAIHGTWVNTFPAILTRRGPDRLLDSRTQ